MNTKQMIMGNDNVQVGYAMQPVPSGGGLRKPWYLSKVLWFNAVVAALATAEISAQAVQPYVSGDVYAWGMAVLTIGNAALRVVTRAQLSMGGGDVDAA